MKLEPLSLLALISCMGLATHSNAQVTVDLGSAESYGVLAGTSVVNTGVSTITGNVGVSPGATVAGLATGSGAPGLVIGTIDRDGTASIQAESDLSTAYSQAAGEAYTTSATTVAYSDQTLSPGVYQATTTMSLAGTVTLNGGANSVFVFQAGSTLTTGSGSDIVLTGGVQAQNIFWQVGSSATLGSDSAFEGSVLALTSITVDTNASVNGDLLAQNGSVTLDTNNITAIPEPAGTSLWLAALAGMALVAGKFHRRLVA